MCNYVANHHTIDADIVLSSKWLMFIVYGLSFNNYSFVLLLRIHMNVIETVQELSASVVLCSSLQSE